MSRYDESANRLEKMRALPNLPEVSRTMAGLFLAMDRVHQKRLAEAKKLLAEAEAELAAADKRFAEGIWLNRAQCYAVLPEVRKAISDAEK